MKWRVSVTGELHQNPMSACEHHNFVAVRTNRRFIKRLPAHKTYHVFAARKPACSASALEQNHFSPLPVSTIVLAYARPPGMWYIRSPFAFMLPLIWQSGDGASLSLALPPLLPPLGALGLATAGKVFCWPAAGLGKSLSWSAALSEEPSAVSMRLWFLLCLLSLRQSAGYSNDPLQMPCIAAKCVQPPFESLSIPHRP